jgi:hypothetical protein
LAAATAWALALLTALGPSPSSAKPRRHAEAAASPVVAELYTAQGCTACPQANALLQELAGRKGVLALTFPVDIWDYLGWSDTLAKPEFTARQRAYIGKLKLREIYTPEIIVDGRKEALGFDREKVTGLVDAEVRRPSRGPRIGFEGAHVEVGAGPVPAGGGEAWLLRFDPQERTVKVTAGENRGKTVVQQNVVRELTRLGAWTGRRRRYPLPAPSADGLKTAVLVQGAKGGPVLAAAVR